MKYNYITPRFPFSPFILFHVPSLQAPSQIHSLFLLLKYIYGQIHKYNRLSLVCTCVYMVSELTILS